MKRVAVEAAAAPFEQLLAVVVGRVDCSF